MASLKTLNIVRSVKDEISDFCKIKPYSVQMCTVYLGLVILVIDLPTRSQLICVSAIFFCTLPVLLRSWTGLTSG